jgi:hypothetical protein
LEDLHKSKLQLWIEDAPFIKYYLPLADKPIEQKIYREKLLGKQGKKPHFVKTNDGVALIRKGLNGKTKLKSFVQKSNQNSKLSSFCNGRNKNVWSH